MTVHDPAVRKAPYPGRDGLDAANRRFRKAIARLHREGLRTNADLIPVTAAIVEDATTTLNSLASQAETTTYTEPTRRTALKAVRRNGSPRAAEILARLCGLPGPEQAPADDQTPPDREEVTNRAWAIVAATAEERAEDVHALFGELARPAQLAVLYGVATALVRSVAGAGTGPITAEHRAMVADMARRQLIQRADRGDG
jgi:hypothetical protein